MKKLLLLIKKYLRSVVEAGMIDALVAWAAGIGVTVVVLMARIFVTDSRLRNNPGAERIGLVIGVAVLAGIGTMWLLL